MMFLSIGIKLLLEQLLPEMAYFNITALTIVIGFSIVAAQAWLKNRRGIRWSDIWHVEDRGVGMMGLMLLASVIFLQIWFH